MEVASGFANIGDDSMHEYLLGRAEEPGHSRYVVDILKYPESAWVIDVPIPDERELYGPVSGQTLPVATFLTYPSSVKHRPNTYAFPYHDATYGVFEDMEPWASVLRLID